MRSFGNGPYQVFREDISAKDSPVIHLEAYSLSSEEEQIYSRWLNEFGFLSLIPLFSGLAGFKGYDCFENSGLKGLAETREWEYPSCVSIIYFENAEAFENYQKSRELIAFQKILRNVFASGLPYKWYVQYQLVKSWRK